MFGCQWEAVGERGRGRALERQDSWLENTAENLGAGKFIFFSVSPLNGDRQGNGGSDDVMNRGLAHTFASAPVNVVLLRSFHLFEPYLLSPVGPGLPIPRWVRREPTISGLRTEVTDPPS